MSNNKPVLIDGTKTKKQLTKELYQQNYNLPKKDIWNLIVEKLNVDIATARTYVWNAAREINPTLNLPLTTRKIDQTKLKRGKAYDLFVQNPNLDRKQMIKLIENSLQITNNSAATHCSMSAKKFKKNFPNINHKAVV